MTMPNSSSPSSLPPPESCPSSSASSAALIFLALILVVLGVVGVVLGRPFVERLAARSIEDRVGTPVDVTIATSVKPGLARGQLGSVTVRAASVRAQRPAPGGRASRLSRRLGAPVRSHLGRRAAPLLVRGVRGDAHARRPRGLPAAAAGAARAAGEEAAGDDGQGHRDTAHGQAARGGGSQDRGPVIDPLRATRRIAVTRAARSAGRSRSARCFDGVHLTGIALHKGRATLTGVGPAGKIRA